MNEFTCAMYSQLAWEHLTPVSHQLKSDYVPMWCRNVMLASVMTGKERSQHGHFIICLFFAQRIGIALWNNYIAHQRSFLILLRPTGMNAYVDES